MRAFGRSEFWSCSLLYSLLKAFRRAETLGVERWSGIITGLELEKRSLWWQKESRNIKGWKSGGDSDQRTMNESPRDHQRGLYIKKEEKETPLHLSILLLYLCFLSVMNFKKMLFFWKFSRSLLIKKKSSNSTKNSPKNIIRCGILIKLP